MIVLFKIDRVEKVVPKAKVGQKVVIIRSKYGHRFQLGEKVTIRQIYPPKTYSASLFVYRATSDDGTWWNLCETEFEIIDDWWRRA